MASEVLEHVSTPLSFMKSIRSALCDGGSLVLTTPDVESVGPATPHGILVPLLSVGYHLVLQSANSLTNLLREAGFDGVEVHRGGGGSLIARCTGGPVPWDSDSAVRTGPGSRDLYRHYLREAAAGAERDGDLWFGLTARAYREAVVASDRPAADALWGAFSAACQSRFGFGPEAGAKIRGDTRNDVLEGLVASEPLCLGPVLLHRAFHRLQNGAGRRSVESLFGQAADACTRLRRSLRRIGSDDGDAEDVGWVAGAEALLCAAERGATDVPERLAALGPSPADASAGRDDRGSRTEHYRRRAFVSLINSTRLEEADRLADVVSEVEARASQPGVLLADDEFDVLFCAGLRELQRPQRTANEAATGPAERALEVLRILREASEIAVVAGRAGSALTLVAPARKAEILALMLLGRTSEANALRHPKPDRRAG
jgi:hypothetical protein